MLPVTKMIIFNIFLVLFATKVTQAVTPLTCYICDDCEVLTEDTPLEVCDENFFASGGSTSSSVMTTASPTTISPGDETISTTIGSTTNDNTETTEMTPETTPSTHPTPPTIVTPIPTTMPPTPTNIGTLPTMAALAENQHPNPNTNENQNQTKPTFLFNQNFTLVSTLTSTTGAPINTSTPTATSTTEPMPSTSSLSSISSGTTEALNDTLKNVTGVEGDSNGITKLYMPSSAFRGRQVRSIATEQITYHCFKMDKTVNGTKVVQRGCSKVSAMEDVCEQVTQNVTFTSCKACSLPKCNSSSALNVSMAAILFALIAAFLRNN